MLRKENQVVYRQVGKQVYLTLVPESQSAHCLSSLPAPPNFPHTSLSAFVLCRLNDVVISGDGGGGGAGSTLRPSSWESR